MSYQMSRVRGSDAYRLLVTRPTSLELICESLGLDRERLLAFNPNLETEELEAGLELIVPAADVQDETVQVQAGEFQSHTADLQAEDDPEETATMSDALAASAPQVTDDAEQTVETIDGAVDSSAEQTTEEAADTEITVTVVYQADTAETASEEPSDSAPESVAESQHAAQSSDTSEAPKTSDAPPTSQAAVGPSKHITWKPFPKSVL